jgi:transcriptional regulator with XRE-family HTH domain
MSNTPERSFVSFLGQKLRKLRKEQNLTQLDLARQVGITNGQISTIERGVSSPSISTLHKIAAVLGVGMAEFFENEPAQQLQMVRKGKGRRIAGTNENVKVEVLAQRGRNGGGNALSIEIAGGELRVSPKPHASEEYFLYVVRGKCSLALDGENHLMEAGDSAYVNARKEQLIKNTGTGPVQFLIVSQSALIGSEVQSFLASTAD